MDFTWTFQDLEKSGFYDIIQIQKLEQVVGNLIRDYYQAVQEKSKISWNSLSEEKKNKLIKYWSREKVRKEQELADKLEEREQVGKTFEKEVEIAKFHEEKGKIKCECWQCTESKKLS